MSLSTLDFAAKADESAKVRALPSSGCARACAPSCALVSGAAARAHEYLPAC